MAAPRASIAVSVTRAGLTLATAFALTRVFAGRSWLFVMVLAAVVPPVFLEWAQRRHWHPLVRLARASRSSASGSPALVADPDDHGRRAYRRVRRSCRSGTRSAARRTRSAPRSCPSRRPVSALVLAFVGVFVAAALTYWIATSLDAPIGAFAPSIALFIVVAAIGQRRLGRARPRCTRSRRSPTCSRSRSTTSSTRRTWFHANRPRGSRLAAGGVAHRRDRGRGRARSSARRCRARAAARSSTTKHSGAATARATCSRRRRRSSASRTSSRSARCRSCSPSTRPRAAYWRVIALDWFTDDNAWGVNKATEQPASKLTTPADLPPSTPLHQQFHIEQLDPHWLPAAYRPVGDQPHRGARRPRLAHPARRLEEPAAATSSTTSTRRSRRRRTAQLDAARRSPTRARWRQDLELPDRLPAAGARRSREQITAERRHAVRRARSRSRSSSAAARSSTRSTPTSATRPTRSRSSCFNTRAGFCEQFAASFAAMARAVGVPARVAVGYQPGHARRRRPLPRDEPQRARLARGVDRGRGLDPVRADARVHGADPRHRHRRARSRSPRSRRRARPPRRRARPTSAGRAADPRAAAPGRRAGADPDADRRRRTTACATRSTVRRDRGRRASRSACSGSSRSCRSRCGAAAGGAGATTIPGGACSARGPKRSTSSASPACRRGRRRPRWSSRCATRPRTARATPGPR